MKDILLVVDAINDFRHDDGDALLASFRDRLPSMVETLESARTAGVPVVYSNDAAQGWYGDAPGLVRRAIVTAACATVDAELEQIALAYASRAAGICLAAALDE